MAAAANLLDMTVVDRGGAKLGVVVARVRGADSADLLVRRRRLFHRAECRRLTASAVFLSDQALAYRPDGTPLRVVRANSAAVSTASASRHGDAA